MLNEQKYHSNGGEMLMYRKTAKTLEDESGHPAESDERVASMLSCVSAGRWDDALALLSDVKVCFECNHFFFFFAQKPDRRRCVECVRVY